MRISHGELAVVRVGDACKVTAGLLVCTKRATIIIVVVVAAATRVSAAQLAPRGSLLRGLAVVVLELFLLLFVLLFIAVINSCNQTKRAREGDDMSGATAGANLCGRSPRRTLRVAVRVHQEGTIGRLRA